MAETFKLLAQGQLGTSAAVLYTAGAGGPTIVKAITLVNDQIADRQVTLWQGGSTDPFLFTPNNMVIPGNTLAEWEGTKIINANGTIQGKADVANDVTYEIYGLEIAP